MVIQNRRLSYEINILCSYVGRDTNIINGPKQPCQHGHNHNTMNHSTMGQEMATGMASNPATEQGQSAFAAIEEIVLALDADPNTDWSKVNISGLREHLVDMELVFTDASVETSEIENGFRFIVTGTGKTKGAIQRMSFAHAGVILTVTTTADDTHKLRAFGFFGIMAMGMHHQDHHWMMATGSNPHH